MDNNDDEKANKLQKQDGILWIPHIIPDNKNLKMKIEENTDSVFSKMTSSTAVDIQEEHIQEDIFERPDDVIDISAGKQKKSSVVSVSVPEKQLGLKSLNSSDSV